MRGQWVAHSVGGGHTLLGYMTRAQALKRLGEIVHGSEVKHVDDMHKFIFYKPQE